MSVGLTQLREDVNGTKRLESDGTLPRWLEVGSWCFPLPTLWGAQPANCRPWEGSAPPLRKPAPFNKAAAVLLLLSPLLGLAPSLSPVQLVRPHAQRSLTGYSPWDSPGKNVGVGCHFLLHLSPENPNILQKAEDNFPSVSTVIAILENSTCIQKIYFKKTFFDATGF